MDNFRESVGAVAKTILKTSSEVFKTTRLRIVLANEEANLKSIYESIGRQVAEIYRNGGRLDDFFDEKYAEVQKTEGKIEDLKSRIETVKKESLAENVPVPVEPFVVQTVAAEETVKETVSEPPRETKKCVVCGVLNDAGEKFCLNCGRML